MTDVSGLKLNTLSAVKLIMGTAATESRMGEFIKHSGGGPGVGVYQVQPVAFRDLVSKMNGNPKLKGAVFPFSGTSPWPMTNQIAGNMFLATSVCRMIYWFSQEALPPPGDIIGLATYYKEYYDSQIGAKAAEIWLDSWKQFNLDTLFNGGLHGQA
jgi:hypothetical protein